MIEISGEIVVERPIEAVFAFVADPANTPPGCHFHPRCNYAQAICREKSPVQEEIAPNHFVSCHRASELSLRGVARSTA